MLDAFLEPAGSVMLAGENNANSFSLPLFFGWEGGCMKLSLGINILIVCECLMKCFTSVH